MLTTISVPADNERGPRYMERAFAAIHEARWHRAPLVFVYGCLADRIGLFIQHPMALKSLVLDPITANYPDCQLAAMEESSIPAGYTTWSQSVTLTPDLFPILRHAQFEDGPPRLGNELFQASP